MKEIPPMKVPIFLNAPLVRQTDDKPLVDLRLRINSKLKLVENDKFDPAFIKYDENYQNSVILSPTFRTYLQHVVETIAKTVAKTTKIIEVGCGKGDFFVQLKKNGFTNITGYDETYEGTDVNIQKRYLTERDKLDGELLILRHTLEHIANPYEFIEFLRNINSGQGTIFIEVPDFDWILRNNAFYDIAYEHVNYFTLEALALLFDDKLLEKGRLFDGQYIYIMARLGDLSKTYKTQYKNKDNWRFIEFNDLFPKLFDTLREIEAKIRNKRFVYIWGGAGKGGTFCHHLKNLSPAIMEKVKFVVDINPQKVGKFLPSSLVRIASTNELFSCASVDDFLIITNPIYIVEIAQELAKNGLRDIEMFAL